MQRVSRRLILFLGMKTSSHSSFGPNELRIPTAAGQFTPEDDRLRKLPMVEDVSGIFLYGNRIKLQASYTSYPIEFDAFFLMAEPSFRRKNPILGYATGCPELFLFCGVVRKLKLAS